MQPRESGFLPSAAKLNTQDFLFFPSSPMSIRSLKRGFTLIELLLVIGIIAILAAIVIVAINPTKQLGDARNAQRRSDVNTILNAVYQYALDHNGNIPTTITTSATHICKSGVSVTCGALVSLNMLTGAYVVAIPNDPQAPTEGVDTNYTIMKDATTSRITVAAPEAEQSATITVTR
jgi:type IV pilus assembly protein PilA